MNKELKPCPFCGGKANVEQFTTKLFAVVCEKCEAETDSYFHKQEAINAWNTRAENTCKIEHEIYDSDLDCYTTKLSCGCSIISGWSFSANYCPNCGAKVVK